MKMKKRSRPLATLLCVLLIALALPITASADTGPKASVRVQFENMGDELCYGTLLAKQESTGPNSVWDGNEAHIDNRGLDMEIWRAFAEYEDTDGYYFLQIGWQVSETKEIAWTYYPPSSFKILLYYPETDKFVVSDIYDKYAFDTYYTVDMAGLEIGSVEYNKELSSDRRINAYPSYNFRMEFGALAARIAITIVIELGIALLYGIRKKKQILLIAVVNVVTQIILNILLNLMIYSLSEFLFVFLYMLCEAIVFVTEAVLYRKLLSKWSDKKRSAWYYIAYAIIANAASLGAGFLLVRLIPSVF